MKSRRSLWIAAWAAAVVLVAAGAWAVPFGANADEALFIILSRELRAGTFRVPGALGWTVTDPWPGFPMLLSLPELLIGSHWALYRVAGLAIWAGFAASAWRLARTCASRDGAAATALLAALCPAVAGQAGLMTPDLAFAALGTFSLAAFAEGRAEIIWAAPAALAALMRPHGVLLLAALAGASLLRRRPRAAIAALAAGIPLASLLLRNWLAAGTLTEYAAHWAAQPQAGPAERAAGLLATTLGDGLLGLFFLPRWAAAAAGAGALTAGAWSARAWNSRVRGAAPAAATLFAGAILALHLGWTTAVPRYAVPLAPLFWTALFANRRGWSSWLGATALVASVFAAAQRAAALPSAPPILEPQTMAWIASSTPPDARFESFAAMPVRLFASREAAAPPEAGSRDAWLADLLRRRIAFVHVSTLRAEGFFPEKERFVARSLENWARSLPFFSVAYENPRESCAVFRLSHPDAARYLRAWDAFEAAGAAARRGAHAAEVVRGLDRALALEPGLALAWAARATFQSDPRKRLADFRKAAQADPTSEMIRQDVATAAAAVGRTNDARP